MKKTKKLDVIAIGGATRDILFYSKEGELISTGNMTKQKLLAFEYGAKISAERIYFDCGGGASNAAVSFAKLGINSAIICRVGHDDNGLSIIKNFKDNNVDTSFIKVDTKTNTGFSVILTVNNEAKEHVAFLYRGANDVLSKKDLQASKLSADWFYITSLPKDNWEGIMDEVVKLKKNIVWNPGAKQLAELPKLKKYLPHIKIFMVNHEEAMEFRKLKDMKGLLTHIYSLGPKLVVITDGKKGAYAYDGKKYYFIRAKSTKAVNTIGVGDAFGSALTSAFICGKNIKESLEWGIKNSASVVGHIGAQKGLLNKKQIER